MYKTIFIAYGGSNIGMGHIFRSMSLAEAFKGNNAEVKFISKYATGQQTLRENEFILISLQGNEVGTDGFNYGSSEELKKDLHDIKKILASEQPDIIVVDSYNVNYEFFYEIGKLTKCLIYIDDICAFNYPVDIIINGNITGPFLGYENKFKNQILLLGLKYNLIRQEFFKIPKHNVLKKCDSIMISTGAADPHNMTIKILRALLSNGKFKDYTINVIIGKAFNDSSTVQIKEIALMNNSIVLYENPSKMSEIMCKSDLAITAGGSTIYELFACGVITFAFIYANNQKEIVETSEKKGYLINLGYYNELKEQDMIEVITRVADDYELRKSIVEKIQGVIDCKGTQRIISEVDKFMMKKVM